MSAALSNKKKVRGWPRRLRRLEAFRERHRGLEASEIEAGRGWVKLGLDPWDRLVPREPPVWLRRRMLDVLLDVHRSWHAGLEAHERATGESFDCQLWLFDPHFSRSQVVFAVGEERAWYREPFPAGPDVPPRPPALYDDSAYRLEALDWTPGLEVGHAWASDLEADPAWARRVERAGVVHEVEAGHDRHVAYRVGRAWVGRLPGSTPA